MAQSCQTSCATCRSLRERLDAAEERVRTLEGVLKPAHEWPRDWGLPKGEQTILSVLAGRREISKAALHFALYGDDPDGGPEPKIIDVMVSRLRARLEMRGIKIGTMWGWGYEMSTADRAKLRKYRVKGGAT